ncbi:MAG: hypothetical protein WBA57_00470 [Elainellaceae cyanobacterium]
MHSSSLSGKSRRFCDALSQTKRTEMRSMVAPTYQTEAIATLSGYT